MTTGRVYKKDLPLVLAAAEEEYDTDAALDMMIFRRVCVKQKSGH